MPFLAIDQDNTRHILALHAVNLSGHLYNPATVTAEVFDSAGGSVFGPDDLTDDGFDTGIFPLVRDGGAAFNPTTEGMSTGSHTVVWTFDQDPDDGSGSRTWTQQFFVEAAGLELPFWAYVSPTEVRAGVGVVAAIDVTTLSDARMLELIQDSQEYLERMCRQPFRPVTQEVRLDGPSADTLFLPIPIVGVDFVKLNDSDQVLAPSGYRVNNYPSLEEVPGYLLPEDFRRNPKIRLRGRSQGSSVYDFARSFGGRRFHDGAQNQRVKGVWGFLEADGTTPRKIREAVMRIISATSEQLEPGSSSTPGGGLPAGPVKRERTDRHEIEYSTEGSTVGTDLALATSPQVEEIIGLYRSPILLGSPANRSIVL